MPTARRPPPTIAARGSSRPTSRSGSTTCTAFGVLVVDRRRPGARRVPGRVEAAGFAGARLVLLVGRGARRPRATSPPDATVLEAPADDDDGAFATLVGAYAAALDAGADPAQAFARRLAARAGSAPARLSCTASSGRPLRPAPARGARSAPGPLLRTLFTSGGTG